MKFVQIGEYDYINVDAIVYIDRENRLVRTNESLDRERTDGNERALGAQALQRR